MNQFVILNAVFTKTAHENTCYINENYLMLLLLGEFQRRPR